ncbi:putative membrane protein (DUF2078) [Desulfosporosinus acidiphilus SJ4]|uniref:Putative membrane protein (DUF2078) n=1 Tax=Desulfosporosinus acidiphilus (strain DSM 22704 / JCM 16185 / SJ4) TaxID=646529 RepID=I4D5W7_DESAJ|nr:SHOCT domain-containing protein [Desulfosporosinus acidiphilus]AFM41191.1 putative membrane protein (DUF2078) [Desulfosporosinus acidiphilus SJ4]
MFFIFILICLIAYFSYHHDKHGCLPYQGNNRTQNALDILRERYARGEINSEEFNERKKILEEGVIRK